MSCFLGFRALSCELELSLGLKFFSSTLSLPSRSVGSQRLNARPFFSLPFMFLQVRFFILLRIHWNFFQSILQGGGDFFCWCCNWSRFRSKSSASDLEVFRVFRCYRSDADANRTDAPFIARAWVQTLSRCSHSWCRDFESNRHKSKETLAGVKNSILFWICANEPLSLTWKDALAYSVNCFCSNFINSTANLKCQLDISRIMFPVLYICCRFL